MHIVIIGNGISGATAARFIRKYSDNQITMISSESPYFFSRTAMMYVYMGHTRWKDIEPYEPWFWKKNRIDLIFDKVNKIDTANKILHLDKAIQPISYDKLIIATGSKTNKYGWPGQELNGVSGLYHKQDLEYITNLSTKIKKAVIIGGGLIGIELVEMFLSRNIEVTMLVREKSYWSNILPSEESQMINNHIIEHKVDLRLNTTLSEIKGNASDNVEGVLLSDGSFIPCQFVGITTGVTPNIDLVQSSEIEFDKGILVDEYLQTNLKDVFAIGDCAQIRKPHEGRQSIEPVWYTGRIMGELVANNICNRPVIYDPGIWFNSAKFFEIEYQIYGFVPSSETTAHKSDFWQHPDGRKSIRIVYELHSEKVVGFNIMGIRYRHEVCEKWIREGTSLRNVLTELSLANFDPEFFATYENELIEQFNRNSEQKIKPNTKGGLKAVLNFLNK